MISTTATFADLFRRRAPANSLEFRPAPSRLCFARLQIDRQLKPAAVGATLVRFDPNRPLQLPTIRGGSFVRTSLAISGGGNKEQRLSFLFHSEIPRSAPLAM